jgi:hypothetical protein
MLPHELKEVTAMNRPRTIEYPARSVDKLVSWTWRERLRFLWYRLRLTISEMNYATRRKVEWQAPWISDPRWMLNGRPG